MDKRYKENDRFDNEEGGSLDRYNCRADAVSMNVYIPYSVSFLVEVLGWLTAAESDYLFRVHVDNHALDLLIVRIMLSSLSNFVATVLADCHVVKSRIAER